MRLILIRDFQGLHYYGYIPETNNARREQIEVFELNKEDEGLLDKDFVTPVDDFCHSLIDPGDVDFLNADQCRLLLGWLRKRLKDPLEPRLEIIYNVLVRFAQKAIELDTGIVFDL